MADGYLGKCKTCTKADSAARIDLKKQDPEWMRQERARCRTKQANYNRLGLVKYRGKKYGRKWAKSNQHKIKAQRKAYYAVKKGIIEKKSACDMCGSPGKVQMHHPDYSQPLKVEFLCTPCHGMTRRIDQPLPLQN